MYWPASSPRRSHFLLFRGFAQEKLTVWWVKGFYKSEDDALFEAIKKFEAKTGVKVELSQYAGRRT